MLLLGKRRQSSLRSWANLRNHLRGGLLHDLKDLGRNFVQRIDMMGTGAMKTHSIGMTRQES